MGSDAWELWHPWKGSLEATLADAQRKQLAVLGFASREAAMAANEEEGTGTIVDIEGFSKTAQAGRCWRLTELDIDGYCDSTTPNRAAIEKGLDELVVALERGESLCATAYHQGKPEAVYFAGWSFD